MQPTDLITNEEELGEKLPQPEPGTRPRKRKRLRLSFLIAGIAVLGAIIYLVVSNTQANAVYYMTVSELKGCKTCVTQDVRVAGVVEAGSIVRNDERQTISFVITEGSQKLPVTYTGVVPDIFAPGITVVVEGNYTGSGPFQAQTLLAKCPSKFQAATPTP
ncbi:MAG TPA: cytochrome c maturation protein CcmE [Ktedonobacteraceae bacterium]|nr:cytochrome c maturation protein CcmE [Ktedonobacteraceae bacterium]